MTDFVGKTALVAGGTLGFAWRGWMCLWCSYNDTIGTFTQ